MRTLLRLIKFTDLDIVVCSFVFSDPALDWGVQQLTTTTAASAAPPGTGGG